MELKYMIKILLFQKLVLNHSSHLIENKRYSGVILSDSYYNIRSQRLLSMTKVQIDSLH